MRLPGQWRQNPVFVVLAGGFIVLISMGLRQSFGVFMQPLTCVLGIDRFTPRLDHNGFRDAET